MCVLCEIGSAYLTILKVPPVKFGEGNFPTVLNLIYFYFRCKVIRTIFLHAAAFSNIVIFQIYFNESSVLNELTEYSMSSEMNYFYKFLLLFFIAIRIQMENQFKLIEAKSDKRYFYKLMTPGLF